MTITAAFVLFAVCWFMIFLIVLPLRLTTQGDVGEVVPGTHKSAPQDAQIKRRAWITTLWATAAWIVLTVIILSGWIGIADIDWFGTMDRTGER